MVRVLSIIAAATSVIGSLAYGESFHLDPFSDIHIKMQI